MRLLASRVERAVAEGGNQDPPPQFEGQDLQEHAVGCTVRSWAGRWEIRVLCWVARGAPSTVFLVPFWREGGGGEIEFEQLCLPT